jgi:uncharacterized membrane protein SpoIIM required for sporulation
MGINHFNREELLGREMDSLNFRLLWKHFRQEFVGGARSIGGWYRREIPRTLRQLAIPIVFMTVLIVVGTYLGASLVQEIGPIPDALNLNAMDVINNDVLDRFRQMGFFNASSVLTIWWHNLLAVTIAFLFGAFTLGVAGVLILILPMALIGFFTGLLSLTGIDPLTILAAVTLPHGLLELPALILVGAAILQVGASLVTPNRKQSISQSLVSSLADFARIMLAIAIPLFLGAAVLEVFFSPRILISLLGGG